MGKKRTKTTPAATPPEKSMPVPRGAGGRFLPGQAPKSPGRPKREIERTYLDATIAGCSMKDWAEIVQVAVQDAKKGDSVAREWLSKHILGLPTQRLEHTGGDEPLKLIISYEDIDGDTDSSA